MTDSADDNGSDSTVQSGHLPTLYRRCTGCGQILEVTYLLPRRKYRCEYCNNVFTHHRSIRVDPGTGVRAPNIWPRMAASGLFSVGMVAIVGSIAELQISDAMFWGISFGTGIAVLIACRVALGFSRDPAGFSASMMLVSALGVIALLTQGQINPEAEQTVYLIVFLWLGIGGVTLSRYLRNQSSLPSVDREGKVTPILKNSASK